MSTPDLALVAALVGAPVVSAERSPYGFTNRTEIVTLHGGARVVLQRVSNAALAPERLRLAALLPERFAAAGLRLPRQLKADPHATPPYAVREYLPGVSANVLLATHAAQVAVASGGLLPLIARVATAALPLDPTWSTGERLVRAASGWLDLCAPRLTASVIATLRATLAAAPALLGGAAPVFAHGDFCPVNVLVTPTTDDRPALAALADHRPPPTEEDPSVVGRRSSVVGLLDVEYARIAHPWFDAAWWGWVLRHHHPEVWGATWSDFLAAAGMPEPARVAAPIRALQQLRLLELLAETVSYGGDSAGWVGRLAAQTAWDV